MKVAAISDIHDNVWALERVLKAIEREGAQMLLVLGDLCAPFSMRETAAGFCGPVHVVFGNNDGDQLLIAQVAEKAGNVTVHGPYAELTPDGVTVAMIHYHTVGRRLAAGGGFGAVFYGHSHEAEVLQLGGCVGVNPGAVMGRTGVATYAVYDSNTGEAWVRDVPMGHWS